MHLFELFYLLYNHRENKYFKFVAENSAHLIKLRNVNNKYTFFPRVNFDQNHIYDNENMYLDIACLDYLLYQLQFISKKVTDQINKENRNKISYQNYLNEISKITEFGVFLIEPGKLNTKKLLSIENHLIKRTRLPQPPIDFTMTVTLYCSRMNGRIYNGKSETYRSDAILSYIARLRNRRGTFYNDRNVWDAICRVERGKVSNRMRFSIYERDGYRCRNCGVSQRYADLEIDHIIPIAKGGKSDYDNLQTLCHKCNVYKGDRIYY